MYTEKKRWILYPCEPEIFILMVRLKIHSHLSCDICFLFSSQTGPPSTPKASRDDYFSPSITSLFCSFWLRLIHSCSPSSPWFARRAERLSSFHRNAGCREGLAQGSNQRRGFAINPQAAAPTADIVPWSCGGPAAKGAHPAFLSIKPAGSTSST